MTKIHNFINNFVTPQKMLENVVMVGIGVRVGVSMCRLRCPFATITENLKTHKQIHKMSNASVIQAMEASSVTTAKIAPSLIQTAQLVDFHQPSTILRQPMPTSLVESMRHTDTPLLPTNTSLKENLSQQCSTKSVDGLTSQMILIALNTSVSSNLESSILLTYMW